MECEFHGCHLSEVNEIEIAFKAFPRQTNILFNVANCLLTLHVGRSEKPDSPGAVHQMTDEDRYRPMAKDYADFVESGKSTLAIALMHVERANVNEAIRNEMKSRGHIHHAGRSSGCLSQSV